MMFVTDARSFYVLRFLLGVAEAGFFPGVILYLTYWFPAAARGPMIGLFYFGAPIAQIFGGPISGLLLEMDGIAGLHGWQWMFLVEGLLASVVGIWTFSYLTDRPTAAKWLTTAERIALQSTLNIEEESKAGHDSYSVVRMLRHPRILQFGLAYCLIQMSVYGVTFYLPSQVARLLGRETGFVVGVVSAVPWVCALLSAFLLPRLAARFGHRRQFAAVALATAGVGIAVSSADSTALALGALCLATAGFIGVQPIFWTFPTGELSGANAAAGIAFINALGALGGFLAPNVKTGAESIFSSSSAGQFALASTSSAGAVLILLFGRRSGATRS
jgi:MFS family permease